MWVAQAKYQSEADGQMRIYWRKLTLIRGPGVVAVRHFLSAYRTTSTFHGTCLTSQLL